MLIFFWLRPQAKVHIPDSTSERSGPELTRHVCLGPAAWPAGAQGGPPMRATGTARCRPPLPHPRTAVPPGWAPVGPSLDLCGLELGLWSLLSDDPGGSWLGAEQRVDKPPRVSLSRGPDCAQGLAPGSARGAVLTG